MRTLYIEDVASCDGPESCAVVREGGGEALAGVRAGSVLSREIKRSGVPTRLCDAEGNIAGGVMREPSADSARSKTRLLSAVRFGHETRPSRRSRWARRGRVGRSAFVVAVVGLQHESPLPVR